MCKTSLWLLISVLFTTVNCFGQDSGLIGYWKFDETSGTTAVDSAGGDHDGTLVGNELGWAPGLSEGALSLWSTTESDDGVEFSTDGMSTNTGTVAMWGYLSDPQPQTSGRYFFGHTTDPRFANRVQLYMQQGTTDSRLLDLGLGDSHNRQNDMAEIPIEEWVHVALTWDFGAYVVYVDGQEVGSGAYTGLSSFHPTAAIGNDGSTPPYEPFAGLLDEVKLYDRALSAVEIRQAMRIRSPGAAFKPIPADNATDISRDVVLSWSPGDFAATHDIYLGTNFDDVNDASAADPMGVRVTEGHNTESFDPGRLDFSETYYWRVDEVNGGPDFTVFKGETWSFAAEPFSVPIVNVTATASSAFGSSQPENTINGSGLNGDLHGTSAGDMWISGSLPASIEYDFNRAYKLHEMWVWNSNQLIEAFVGFGAKDVTIETSLDGQAWQPLDGQGPLAQAPGSEGYAHNNTVDFTGVTAQFVRITVNTVQGIAPQASLSEVRFYAVPTSAARPDPPSGATGVAPDTTLSWGRDGREADSHDVYLGTDAGDLALVGQIDESGLGTETLDLQLGQTYTWRVDEVNEAMDPSTWIGDAWSFTTVDALVIDDMETYADKEFLEIWATWVDGFDDPTNGSLVGADPAIGDFAPETGIVHGGSQSLPIWFDNSTVPISEATRTFEQTQDWTRSGV